MTTATTYTFDGTTAHLAGDTMTFTDAELPNGGTFEFVHADRRTLGRAVAGAMPGYVACGSISPFMARRLEFVACKAVNRAALGL